MALISNLLTPTNKSFASLTPPKKQFSSLMPASNNANAVAQAGGGQFAPNNSQGFGGMSIAPKAPVVAAQTQTAGLVKPATAPTAGLTLPPAPPQQGNAQNIPSIGSTGQTLYTSGTPDSIPNALQVAQTGTGTPSSRGLFPSVAASLANPQPTQMTTDATTEYNKAVEDLLAFRKSEAGTKQAIDSAPTSARVMQGREQAVQAANASKEAALQGAVQEKQAGIGFGQAQQSLNQSALSSIAGLVKPTPTSYGQTVFNPETGTFTGGNGNLDPQTAASDLAQKVASNQMTYEQAVSSLGYAGSAGQQFLNAAIKAINPNFNVPQNTATTIGAANVIGSLPDLTSKNTAAEGIKGKITTYLSQNPQINPSNLAVGNTLQQWLQGKQLTDPKYQTLFNYINEYTSTLAPILGVGGDTTNLKTQIAQGFINAAASGQSIASVLEDMQALSTGKLQDLASGATGGGVVSSPQSPSSAGNSSTGGGGLYDF